jgi:hypothetical protein
MSFGVRTSVGVTLLPEIKKLIDSHQKLLLGRPSVYEYSFLSPLLYITVILGVLILFSLR